MSLKLCLYFIYLLLAICPVQVDLHANLVIFLLACHIPFGVNLPEFGRQLGVLVEQLLRRIHWLRLDLVALCW